MENEYSEAISETLEVLKYLEDELLNKIPLDVIKKLKDKKSDSYINKFDELGEVDSSKLSEKTKDILAVLYRDYIANEQEKIEFDKMLYKNQKDMEQYTNQIFEKQEREEIVLPAVVKKSLIQKIFEKLFKFKKSS